MVDVTQMEDLMNEVIWMRPMDDIVNTIIGFGTTVVVAIILFGVLTCFFGYKLFRWELAIIGAVGLGTATYLVLYFFLKMEGMKLYLWTAFAAFMGFGMLFTVQAILVFLLTLIGITLFLMIDSAKRGTDLTPEIIIVVAMATALIAGLLYKHIIIIGSSALGAAIVGVMCSHLFDDFLGLLVGVVMAVLGIVIQYWMLILRKKKERRLAEKQQADRIAKRKKKMEKKAQAEAAAEGGAVDYVNMFPSQADISNSSSERKAVAGNNSGNSRASVAALRVANAQGTTPTQSSNQASTPRVNQQAGQKANSPRVSQQAGQKASTPKASQQASTPKASQQASAPRVATPTASASNVEPPVMTPTGTISVGDLKSKMLRK